MDLGSHVSVAIHPGGGIPYVSYYNASNGHLRMAKYVGSGGNCGPDNDWSCETVDSNGDVGKYSSIAINPIDGQPGIAYHDATYGRLKYARSRDWGWEFTNVDYWTDDVVYGLYTSLKYHSNGTPYIAYYIDNPNFDDSLKVAQYVGSGGGYCVGGTLASWRCDTIDKGEGVGKYASLALDGAGNRHVAYYDEANGDLWYATSRIGTNCGPGGNSWLCMPVDAANNVGQYASLYVDNNGLDFHIAYYDATADMLKYAVDVGSGGNCGLLGSAQCDEIDSMRFTGHPRGVSVARDAAGYPIIAYQANYGSLNVARPAVALGLSGGGGNCGPADPLPTWKCETINSYGFNIHQADFVSIDVSSAGLATIAYYGNISASSGDLKVAYQRLQAFLPLVAREP